VSFEAAERFFVGLSLGPLPADVGARRRIHASLGEADDVEGGVQLAVAQAREEVTVAASRGDGRSIGDQVLAVVDEELQLTRLRVVGGRRQAGLAQGRTSGHERLDPPALLARDEVTPTGQRGQRVPAAASPRGRRTVDEILSEVDVRMDL
jgi:hypothetical protein